MTDSALDRKGLKFLLFDWLRVEDLLTEPYFATHSRGTIEAALDLAENTANRWFASTNAVTDRNEPGIVNGRVELPSVVGDALKAFAETGLGPAAMPIGCGGLQLPLTVQRACFAWFQASNISIAAYPMLTLANANLLLQYGSADQVERLAQPMIEGRWSGTMCLSEPQAGSSLADIRTRAEIDVTGRYRITGTKMWISAGDHELAENIVHLVLARTDTASSGTKRLSLFAVPKWLPEADGRMTRNDVVFAGLNHKMGYRGTVNTMLAFGDGTYAPGGRAGAVGELVGAEGAGLAAMFHMMNEARIGVGAGAAAVACAGYRYALNYARQRRQGRRPGTGDPNAAPVAIIEYPDVRRMLLAAKAYAEGGLALCLRAAHLIDQSQVATADRRERNAAILDLLTPVVKTWPSQWGLVANDLAIQILGGYGYTRDYPVEQLYRDNRLNPIHEGTTGVHALDLLGRKVRGDQGAALRLLVEDISATVTRAATEPMWEDAASDLAAAVSRLSAVTERLVAEPDHERATADAVAYLDVLGHIVVSWLWVDIALAARSTDDPVQRGKRLAAQYFLARELPNVHPTLDRLERVDDMTLTCHPSWIV